MIRFLCRNLDFQTCVRIDRNKMVQEEIDNHHLQGLNVGYGADVSEFLDTELHVFKCLCREKISRKKTNRVTVKWMSMNIKLGNKKSLKIC